MLAVARSTKRKGLDVAFRQAAAAAAKARPAASLSISMAQERGLSSAPSTECELVIHWSWSGRVHLGMLLPYCRQHAQRKSLTKYAFAFKLEVQIIPYDIIRQCFELHITRTAVSPIPYHSELLL